MAKTAVSVIVPVYNGERYLEECLDSILQQSFQGWQMVCINDGSTDRSLQILERYAQMDDRISVLTQDNRGLSASRNMGLDCAEGEYIIFLDCDDRLTSGALERLYTQASRDQLDILYYDGDTFYDEDLEAEGNYERYRQLYHAKTTISGVITGIEMFRRLFDSGSYRASACMQMLRRVYLKETGVRFYCGIMYEDNIFTFKTMTQAKRTGYCHRTIYERRMHGGSIVTAQKDFRHMRSYVIAYVEMSAYFFQNRSFSCIAQGVIAQLNSLMQHAAEIYMQLSEDERLDIAQKNADGRLILDMAAGWCAQNGLQDSSLVRAARNCERRARKLHYLLKTQGMRGTAAFCMAKLAKEEDYRPSKQAARYCRVRYNPDAPFVSVVLPVFNGERYLKETIASLRKQRLRNAEFIFVDDGSEDYSAGILEVAAKRDVRIRLIRKPRENAGAARNRGLDEARGKYVIFLDSDDTFDPRLLVYAYDRAEQVEAEVVMFDADVIELPENKRQEPAWMKQTKHLPQGVFAGADAPDSLFQMLNPWTKLYRCDYIRRGGFRYQSQYATNDAYFTIMALACAQRITTMPLPLVHYHIGRSGNIQSNKDREPLSAYHAFLAARMDLRERGMIGAFDRALAIKAAESMIRELDTLQTEESRATLLTVLREGGLTALGFDGIRDDAQASERLGEKLRRCIDIMEG